MIQPITSGVYYIPNLVWTHNLARTYNLDRMYNTARTHYLTKTHNWAWTHNLVQTYSLARTYNLAQMVNLARIDNLAWTNNLAETHNLAQIYLQSCTFWYIHFQYFKDAKLALQATYPSTFICGLPKVQNLLQKLHIINQNSTSICDLRSDAPCLNTSFPAYQKCGTTPARWAWTERAKNI